MRVRKGHVISVALALIVAGLLIIALRPSSMKVEAARVERGPLRVTVEEEGETRAHDRFVVAAPITGRLIRVELEDGDAVALGQVVASINPLPLDEREREELQARVKATESLKLEADQRTAHAQADYEQARRERERAERLAGDGLISRQALEQARNLETTSASELAAAKFKAAAAASEVKVAKAGLIAIEAERSGASRLIKLRSPVRGRVLRIIEKSERVVRAGTPLVILGDPSKLEVVADFLSTDVVKIKAGMPVVLEGWGGEPSLRGLVRVVEASAFTKVSALGIEEQRVNVIVDFVDLPGPLGDGFRVEAQVILWEGEQVLKVPSSALFRHSEGWSVFVIENGRARQRDIETGHRSQLETEVRRGVEEGDAVILHPANQLADGARVEPR